MVSCGARVVTGAADVSVNGSPKLLVRSAVAMFRKSRRSATGSVVAVTVKRRSSMAGPDGVNAGAREGQRVLRRIDVEGEAGKLRHQGVVRSPAKSTRCRNVIDGIESDDLGCLEQGQGQVVHQPGHLERRRREVDLQPEGDRVAGSDQERARQRRAAVEGIDGLHEGLGRHDPDLRVAAVHGRQQPAAHDLRGEAHRVVDGIAVVEIRRPRYGAA